jgi:IclR family acetate operon transcriptional repressor
MRGFRVLEALSARRGPVSLSELAREAEMSKSGMFRILATLIELGYVVQDRATSHYSLTDKILRVAQQLPTPQTDLRTIARPALESLQAATGEAVHLGIPVDDEFVYIDKIESTHSLRLVSSIGRRIPLHCTSLGKAYLAFRPEPEVVALLERIELSRHTPSTITEIPALLSELHRTHERGYSIDDEENEPGVRCVGVPILDAGGWAIGGMSVSGPTIRITRESVGSIGPVCIEAADSVSTILGGLAIEDAT